MVMFLCDLRIIYNEKKVQSKEIWDPAVSLKSVCAFANNFDNCILL